jgi:hypothetical protein
MHWSVPDTIGILHPHSDQTRARLGRIAGRSTTLLIETRGRHRQHQEICQVEGIDCLTIIPFDLSTELGVSGVWPLPNWLKPLPIPSA